MLIFLKQHFNLNQLIEILGVVVQSGVLITSVYAIFQTKAALNKNEKSLELARQDNELLKKQLIGTFKSSFMFDFEHLTFNLNQINVNNINEKLFQLNLKKWDEYSIRLSNSSKNIAYEIHIENFPFMNLNQLKKFEKLLNGTDLYYIRDTIFINSLSSGEETEITFSRKVKKFLAYCILSEIQSTTILYLKLSYKDTFNELNTLYYKFNPIFRYNTIEYSIGWNQKIITAEEYDKKLTCFKNNISKMKKKIRASLTAK